MDLIIAFDPVGSAIKTSSDAAMENASRFGTFVMEKRTATTRPMK